MMNLILLLLNGLSFAAFTTEIIAAADFEVFSTAKQLYKFQSGKLFADSLLNFIELSNELNTNITNTRF